MNPVGNPMNREVFGLPVFIVHVNAPIATGVAAFSPNPTPIFIDEKRIFEKQSFKIF
jgi:hypothetical protein